MNKRLRHGIAAALMLVGCAGLLAPGAWAQSGKIELGVITPLTGRNAVQGQDILRGIQLAARRINAGYAIPLKGGKSQKVGPGLLGKKLELKVEDTESRPASAMDSTRKLVNVDKVPMVLGVLSSGIAVPTGQFTNSNHVVEIVSSATSPQLRSIGPYFFSAMGLDNLMGQALGKFAMKDSGGKRFASIVANNPFGVGMEIEACKALKAQGGKCVTKVRYEQGKSDYRPELRRLMSQHPDGVLITAYGTDARLILQQAYELGLNVSKNWYADYPTLWSNEIKDHPEVGEGIKGLKVGVSGDFYESEYAKPYQKAFGQPPTTAFGAYAYDSMMLAALAIDKAGSTDPDAVRKALIEVSQDYKGVTGDKSFDKDGMQKTEDYQPVIYHNGKLVPYSK